jgi:HD superfamily phosphohydrolase
MVYHIRDPVHGDIEIDKDIYLIINSPLFQRLRYVKQLSSADILYPCGTHTRFAHCLGAMYIANKYSQHLFPNNINKIKLLNISALLHDIAHVFSHDYDDTVYKKIYPGCAKGHDEHRKFLILNDPLKSLIENCGINVNDIIDLWDKKNRTLYDIVQGAIGSDRLDFTIRDAYFTGAGFGVISLDRIINNSYIENDKLQYDIKCLDDIFHFLSCRYYMYKNVYHHKVSFVASILTKKMLDKSSKCLNLVERTKNINDFIYLNDYTILGEIFSSKDPNMKEAQMYCKRLLNRDLPKMFYEKIVESNNDEQHNDIINEMNKIKNKIKTYYINKSDIDTLGGLDELDEFCNNTYLLNNTDLSNNVYLSNNTNLSNKSDYELLEDSDDVINKNGEINKNDEINNNNENDEMQSAVYYPLLNNNKSIFSNPFNILNHIYCEQKINIEYINLNNIYIKCKNGESQKLGYVLDNLHYKNIYPVNYSIYRLYCEEKYIDEIKELL